MTTDFETRSFLDVTEVGSWRYAEDPTTEILCLSYKLGDGVTKLWTPNLPFPKEIIDHVEAGGTFEAHNVQFERAIWYYLLHLKFGIPMPKRWRDTLAACAYRGLPLGLDKAGEALGLPIQKDKRGKYLIQTLCVPKGATKSEPDRVYREDFDLVEELFGYCVNDSDTEHGLSVILGPLPTPEQKIWVLDQVINQRGVQLDVEAVECALMITEALDKRLTAELRILTNDEVETASQRDRIIRWLQRNGVRIPDLKKETVEDYLKHPEDLPPSARRVLEIRQLLARASTKKLVKMLETVNADGRIRGMLQYHGASTGRWAGRLVQPHNFPRGNSKLWKMTTVDDVIENIKFARTDLEEAIARLEFLYEGVGPIGAISSALRGMFIAGKGKTLMVADFSAIEARVVMWVAGCKKALTAFAAYDRKEGPDIYCVMAQELYQKPINKRDHPEERQLGKITVLGCGYQMGGEKLQYQAEKDYGVVLDIETATWLVQTYRESYPEVKYLWYGLQDAAIKTVQKGVPHTYSCIRYEIVNDNAGKWLTCRLPNGRLLWYYDPIIETVETAYGIKPQLTYMGRDNKKGGSWGRIRTYGGMLTENVVQAIARDLMVEGMIRVERADYPIILTVHDEIVAEPDEGHGSLSEFNALMAGPNSAWATGCPVSVEGWEGPRYKKA
jgi:DNA polymerase